MGQDSKTRQANYRKRNWLAGVSRLEVMIEDDSVRKLRRLAALHGVSQRIILQRLIDGADKCLPSVIGNAKLPVKR